MTTSYLPPSLSLSLPPSPSLPLPLSPSGVPLERQKLMVGGLKVGDENWNNVKLKLKNNMTFLLMGSADTLPEAPKEKTTFIEDMTESEAAAAVS